MPSKLDLLQHMHGLTQDKIAAANKKMALAVLLKKQQQTQAKIAAANKKMAFVDLLKKQKQTEAKIAAANKKMELAVLAKELSKTLQYANTLVHEISTEGFPGKLKTPKRRKPKYGRYADDEIITEGFPPEFRLEIPKRRKPVYGRYADDEIITEGFPGKLETSKRRKPKYGRYADDEIITEGFPSQFRLEIPKRRKPVYGRYADDEIITEGFPGKLETPRRKKNGNASQVSITELEDTNSDTDTELPDYRKESFIPRITKKPQISKTKLEDSYTDLIISEAEFKKLMKEPRISEIELEDQETNHYIQQLEDEIDQIKKAKGSSLSRIDKYNIRINEAEIEKLKGKIMKDNKKESFIPMEAYCVKCRTKQQVEDPYIEISSNGRRMQKANCSVCGTNTTTFLPNIKSKL